MLTRNKRPGWLTLSEVCERGGGYIHPLLDSSELEEGEPKIRIEGGYFCEEDVERWLVWDAERRLAGRRPLMEIARARAIIREAKTRFFGRKR